MKYDKCINCGASIDYSKVENGIYRCEYCREYYHIDQYQNIEEYNIKLKIGNKIRTFYITERRFDLRPSLFIRMENGKFIEGRASEPHITLTLESYD